MPKCLRYITVLLLFSFSTFYSCKTDFEVNAPYKEQNAVYGLLELNQPTQIIKINKLFQNGNGVTAYQAAGQIDSLYQKDSLIVLLVDNESAIGTHLTRYFDQHKDSGLFASPGQYLYKTPAGFTLNKNDHYTLVISNSRTGVVSTASTAIVGDILQDIPNITTQVNFPNTPTGYFRIAFTPGNNAVSYDLNINFSTRVYRKSDSAFLRRETVTWNILKNYSVSPGGKVFYSILGKDFYSYIGASLKPDPSVMRLVDSLDFDFIGAGQELANYISVNTPTLGIVQKKPDYTNVSNGAGIFSSRLHTHVYAPLADPSFDILISSGATKALNFRK
jgi:hypothetical protein